MLTSHHDAASDCLPVRVSHKAECTPFEALIAFIQLIGQPVQVPVVLLDLCNGDALRGVLHEYTAQQVFDRYAQIELIRDAIVQFHDLGDNFLEV